MFYYLTSEDGKQTRSLKRYDGESVVEIAKDIRQFNVLPKGYVFYERNFKPETNERDLYEWHDGNTRKIDDGIVMYTFYIR